MTEERKSVMIIEASPRCYFLYDHTFIGDHNKSRGWIKGRSLSNTWFCRIGDVIKLNVRHIGMMTEATKECATEIMLDVLAAEEERKAVAHKRQLSDDEMTKFRKESMKILKDQIGDVMDGESWKDND